MMAPAWIFDLAAAGAGEGLKGIGRGSVDVCLRLQKSCKLPVDYVRVGVVECLQLN